MNYTEPPYKLFQALVALLLLCSCEEAFDPSFLEREHSLVVISQFQPGESVVVRVSQTRSVVDPQEITYVEDAVVTIWSDSQQVSALNRFEDPQTESSYYSSKAFIPSEGVLYTILVEAPGFRSVSAQSFIPQPIPLDDLIIEDRKVDSLGETYSFSLVMRFEDPVRTNNYYHLNLAQEVVITSEKGEFIELRKLPFGSEYNSLTRTADLDGGLLFEDKDFNGRLTEIRVPVQVEINPDRERLGVTQVELRSVTEEYYLFQTSISKQSNNNSINPLNEPALLFNNIKNGHGVFAGYSTTRRAVSF